MTPGIISTVGPPFPTLSRRDFLASAWALLLPPRPKGKLGLKASSALSPIRFREVAQQAGLEFVPHKYPTPSKHMIETMTERRAAIDYNKHGQSDLLVSN